MASFTEEDWLTDACANCGKRQDAVSNLTELAFFVNTANKCGHKFCSSCIERELYKKRQFACPKCRNMVSRDKLSAKSLDETEVERDSSIRRKILAIFNKGEDDFISADEFRDYQEKIEDVIYNLVNMIDVEQTNGYVEQYKQQHAREIAINQVRRGQLMKEEQIAIREREDKKKEEDTKYLQSFAEERAQKKERRRQINQIMLGERDASQLPSLQSRSDGDQQQHGGGASSVPNPVLAFLSQRDEPRAVDTSASSNKKAPVRQHDGKIRSKADLKAMHQAGGYDFASYDKRNWAEIWAQVPQTPEDSREQQRVSPTAGAVGATVMIPEGEAHHTTS